MKTLQLKTLPLLLVELPEGAHGIKMFNDIGRPYISYFVGVDTFRHYTDQDVDLIGKLSELPDEWLEKYVEPEKTFEHTKHYWDYMAQEYAPMCYYREFFYSLLESKEQVYMSGNPQQAEFRTFDPERTYIFELKTEKQ